MLSSTIIHRNLARASAAFSCLILASVFAAGAPTIAAAADQPAALRAELLSGVTSWHYQLQRTDIDQLSSLHADLLVIDFAGGRPQKPLKKADVARLKTKPTGGRRIVLAYLSIGEAEEYRFYWQPAWNEKRPDFLVKENCEWPKNHLVRFWHDGWKSIIMKGQGSYLQRIHDAGFDGVYLDLVDAYEPLQRERPDARAAMISFVTELAATARRQQPTFLVMPQNADELLGDRGYRQVIDGIGRESLLFRAGKGRRQPERVRTNVERLKLLRAAGKPVLMVEYVDTPEDAAAVHSVAEQHRFVPVIATRALDGRNPLAPKPPSKVATLPPQNDAGIATGAAAPTERPCMRY